MPMGWRPNHPGDPTPKWGLSRAGWLAVGSAAIAAVLIGLAIRIAGAADDPSFDDASTSTAPPSWNSGLRSGSPDEGVAIVTRAGSASPEPVGQLVEVPERGFAITLPSDWDAWTNPEDPELGFIVVSGPERFGASVRMDPVMAAEPEGQEPSGLPHACTLTLYQPIAVTPDAFLGELFGQANHVAIESLEGGLSRAQDRPFSSDGRHHAFYAIGSEQSVALLWCWAVEPPQDRWLSIAETFEFLPREE